MCMPSVCIAQIYRGARHDCFQFTCVNGDCMGKKLDHVNDIVVYQYKKSGAIPFLGIHNSMCMILLSINVNIQIRLCPLRAEPLQHFPDEAGDEGPS